MDKAASYSSLTGEPRPLHPPGEVAEPFVTGEQQGGEAAPFALRQSGHAHGGGRDWKAKPSGLVAAVAGPGKPNRADEGRRWWAQNTGTKRTRGGGGGAWKAKPSFSPYGERKKKTRHSLISTWKERKRKKKGFQKPKKKN